MNDSDFFPCFAEREIALSDVSLYARIGGAGPPLVLLHGYPQSHVMCDGSRPRSASASRS